MSTSAGARAVRLINLLTHSSGTFGRQPFNLRPWQQRIIRKLFRTRPDGLRIYRTCLLMLPRKNGKTELAAAIAIYCLLFDQPPEIGGEIYLAAADKEQASKVFLAMVAMIENDAELDAQVEIIRSTFRITHRASGSFCRVISAEAYTAHSFNASVVIYDELHCAPTRDLWDVLVTSQGARAQPLMIAISTAGFDKQSILYELYSHAKRVLENPSLDPTFLPIIYEMPVDADWTDEREWRKANPALGDFRSLEEMRTSNQRAQQIPAFEMAWRRLYGNQWTESAERWVSLAAWDVCNVCAEPAA
jgi:phage terminase large subunit-like protein